MPGSLRAQQFPPTAASTWRDAVNQAYLSKAVVFAAAFSFGVSAVDPADAETWTMSVSNLARIDVGKDGRPMVIDQNGAAHLVSLVGNKVRLQPVSAETTAPLPEGALPDGVIATSKNGMKAWLDVPTRRYGHGVLGDAIEAGGLTVEHPNGVRHTLQLGDDTVFEDRFPRFADMDGDGEPEIILVKAYLNAGGALVLIAPGDADTPPRIVAEATPIGTPNRWLNPAGVGDIDGDGKPEALVVITPHIGGTLTAYEWRDIRLVIDHEIYGFSNHAIGSRELALSTVVDLDGDGVAEVVVPDAYRKDMTVVSFSGASPKIIARTSTSGQVAHRVVVHDLDDDNVPEITFATSDHNLIVWQPGLLAR